MQILRYMCDQHFDNEHVLEVYQGHQARLSQLRKDRVRQSCVLGVTTFELMLSN